MTKPDANGWYDIGAAQDQSAAPWDGVPVLIYTNHNWGGETNRIHRARWTDIIHGSGIFGWVVEDCKFGPWALRGYTLVTHWQPLPEPPVSGGASNPTYHASTSPGPINCQIRQRFQGEAYPRSCQRCGLGPCPFFHNDGRFKARGEDPS